MIVAGCEGLDIPIKKLIVSMNSNGFKTVCIQPDDFHDVERLKNTVEKIRKENIGSKVYAVGVDYGANLLVNFAAKNDKALDGIVSLGNPLNL